MATLAVCLQLGTGQRQISLITQASIIGGQRPVPGLPADLQGLIIMLCLTCTAAGLSWLALHAILHALSARHAKRVRGIGSDGRSRAGPDDPDVTVREDRHRAQGPGGTPGTVDRNLPQQGDKTQQACRHAEHHWQQADT